MGVASWKVSELMIRVCGVNPGKVMVQKNSFQVQSVSVKKKYDIHIGTAEMISVREKLCKHGNSRNDQCQ